MFLTRKTLEKGMLNSTRDFFSLLGSGINSYMNKLTKKSNHLAILVLTPSRPCSSSLLSLGVQDCSLPVLFNLGLGNGISNRFI